MSVSIGSCRLPRQSWHQETPQCTNLPEMPLAKAGSPQQTSMARRSRGTLFYQDENLHLSCGTFKGIVVAEGTQWEGLPVCSSQGEEQQFIIAQRTCQALVKFYRSALQGIMFMRGGSHAARCESKHSYQPFLKACGQGLKMSVHLDTLAEAAALI